MTGHSESQGACFMNVEDGDRHPSERYPDFIALDAQLAGAEGSGVVSTAIAKAAGSVALRAS